MLDMVSLKKCSCECVGPVTGSRMGTEDGWLQDHNNTCTLTMCVYFIDCKTTGRLLLYISFS